MSSTRVIDRHRAPLMRGVASRSRGSEGSLLTHVDGRRGPGVVSQQASVATVASSRQCGCALFDGQRCVESAAPRVIQVLPVRVKMGGVLAEQPAVQLVHAVSTNSIAAWRRLRRPCTLVGREPDEQPVAPRNSNQPAICTAQFV